jgi:hypothetical protein
LGVVAHDVDRDGDLDLYVANDGEPNRLWLNQADGTFVDEALLAGCALNEQGRAEAGMGIVCADLDGDGVEDLFVTHLAGETNTYYVARPKGLFDDRSNSAGLATPSRPFTGFGVVGVDFDNDGWIDLAIANGAVTAVEDQRRAGSVFPLAQRDQLFRNERGRFVELTGSAAFDTPGVGRGMAAGDLDNDGDTDLIVTQNAGALRVLLNQTATGHHWLGLRFPEPAGSTVRARRVEATLGDGRRLARRVARDGSYLSSSDPRVLLGLGTQTFKSLRVWWSDGSVDEYTDLAAGRYHDVRPAAKKDAP